MKFCVNFWRYKNPHPVDDIFFGLVCSVKILFHVNHLNFKCCCFGVAKPKSISHHCHRQQQQHSQSHQHNFSHLLSHHQPTDIQFIPCYQWWGCTSSTGSWAIVQPNVAAVWDNQRYGQTCLYIFMTWWQIFGFTNPAMLWKPLPLHRKKR